MKASKFLSDKEIDLLFQLRKSVNEYVPLLTRWVDSGMPYNEHLQKAREQQEWIESTISNFELVERS